MKSSTLKIKINDCEFIKLCLKTFYENLAQYSGYSKEELEMETQLRLDTLTMKEITNTGLRDSTIKEVLKALKSHKIIGFKTTGIYNILSRVTGLSQTIIQQIDENQGPLNYQKGHLQENTFTDTEYSIFDNQDLIFLQNLHKAIELNLSDQEFGIEKLSAQMNKSRSHLYRKIKELTNHSVKVYIRKIRLNKGLKMLLNGDNTISEISFATGFSNPSYFTSCFKKQYGFTPREYLKKTTII